MEQTEKPSFNLFKNVNIGEYRPGHHNHHAINVTDYCRTKGQQGNGGPSRQMTRESQTLAILTTISLIPAMAGHSLLPVAPYPARSSWPGDWAVSPP
jgi:hypothetical protein